MRYIALLSILLLTCCSPRIYPTYRLPKLYHNPTKNTTVIYLDFNGGTVKNTLWSNNTIVLNPSNFNNKAKDIIRDIVAEDFSPFNVIVTCDSNLYKKTYKDYKMKVYITTTLPNQIRGGVAYINSYKWQNETPGFVYQEMLSNSPFNVAEAVSHEVGHMCGLQHHSYYDTITHKLIDPYYWGIGDILWNSPNESYAPLMGTSYDKTYTLWGNGRTPKGWDSLQNDLKILTSSLGLKTDDYGNNPRHAYKLLKIETNGQINSGKDEDWFYFDVKVFRPVVLHAYPNLYEGRGLNTNLSVTVYNGKGKMIFSNLLDNDRWIYTYLELHPDRYYIQITNKATKNCTRDQLLGTYRLVVN